MGWAFCGPDKDGREMGYGVEAPCDEPDCTTVIDRGLAFLCGDMHEDERTCAKYYCGDHQTVSNRCERCKAIPREGAEEDEEEEDEEVEEPADA